MKNYIDDSSITIDKILEDCQLALKVKYKLQKIRYIYALFQHVKDVRSRETDKDKQTMYDKQISTVENALQNIDSLPDVETKRKVNI